MSDKSGVSKQVLSLPSGGGAVSGTGGKSLTDLQTGAANRTVPIEVPEGRNGLHPDVALSYSTGNSHGIAGMGWSLGTAAISRKTSDGVPVYDDTADTFVLQGGTELVAVDRWTEDAGTEVTRYRPRTEGTFARITHHSDATTDHWIVESRDGSVSYYGTPDSHGSDPATVAKPGDRTDVFAWYLTATEDEFGNRIEYEYRRDMAETDQHHWDGLYLDHIQYVDYETDSAQTEFLVSVDFEYERRPDPNSTYAAGFEQRTRDRLSGVAVRTHAERDRTVRSYELTYRDQRADATLPANGVSQLAAVEVVGHDEGDTERMPAMEFEYSTFEPEGRDFETVTGPAPRRSLAAPELELADISGDGLPDIVEIDDEVRYWPNAGEGAFEGARTMDEAPAGLSLARSDVQLMDANGDGRIDLVSFAERLAGYFPLTHAGGWSRDSFTSYEAVPSVDVDAPEVQLLDLDGNGVTDMVRSGSSLECFFQDSEQGWTETRSVAGDTLEEIGHLDFADPRVRVSDLAGDGLQDIVMVSDGHVSYWPNLGYGNWGKRVRMANPPTLPRDYDPGRLLLGDVDGDGLADMVYVEDDRVTLWLNRCGNGWSEPVVVEGTPSVTDTDAIRLVDLHGTGIGGLLYSGGGRPGSDEMYFLDFVGGRKPYLLTETRNGRGLSIRLEYAPSTEFYLQADREGDGWKTTLPRPMWVVSKEESVDRISGRKLTSQYSYYHGHWDGVEREFRGFGRVEQRDTESFQTYNGEGLHDKDSFETVDDRTQFSPPTLTRTWFHLGPVGPEHGGWRELEYGDEYWHEDPSQLSRPDPTRDLLERLDRRDQRDAVRALSGRKLRTEVYALDGSQRSDRPYRVTEQEFGIRREDSAGDPRASKPVFFPHADGGRSTDWERGSDPMTRFRFVSEYDRYGQSRTNVSIVCPRGWRHDRPSPTSDFQATYSTTRYTYDDDDRYMVDRVVENRSYLLVASTDRTIGEFRSAIESDSVAKRLTGLSRHYYDGDAFEGKQLGRLGEYGARVRTEQLVLTDEHLDRAYPSGTKAPDTGGTPPALASNPTWSSAYPREFRTVVPARAGYITADISGVTDISGATTGYFAVKEQVEFDFQTERLATERGLVRRRRDALDRESTILQYDAYDMHPLRTEDASGLRTEAAFDYSAMAYWQMIDPNDNRFERRYSPLGRVTAEIQLGDPDEREGDTPEQPSVRYEYEHGISADGVDGDITPPYVHITKRKRHRWDLVEEINDERAAAGKRPLSDSEIEALFENERADHPERFVQKRRYLDGHGNTIQTRRQAEATVFTDSNGEPVLPTDISETPATTLVGESRAEEEPRVSVSEWQRFDNKGNVVESFEPFYETGWAFTGREAARREHPDAFDRKTTMHYDGLDRQVRTVAPDGSETRVLMGDPAPDLSDPDSYEPTPWVQYQYDAVDNAGRSHGQGARSYDHRWNTPTSRHVDLEERTQTTVTRNREPNETGADAIEERRTTVQYDPWDNTMTTTDELGRETETVLSDLAGNTLRREHLDAGTTWRCYDAAGNRLEMRDSKGAIRLQAIDEHGRPSHVWARDGPSESVTLRQRLVYGEDTSLDRETAKARNLLGAVHRGYDESGLVTVDDYDFAGNPEAKRQELLGDDIVAGGPIDWQPGPTENWTDREQALLSGREYEIQTEHDALGRLQVQRFPDDVRGRSMALHMEYSPSGSLNGAELVVDPGETTEQRERYLEAVGRDSKERPVVKAYGNGVLERSAYDERTKRLERQRIESYTSSGTNRLQTTGTVHRDIAYEYDVGGNVLESREQTTGVGVAGSRQPSVHGQPARGRNTMVRSFEYDAVGQLRRATGRECTSLSQPRSWGGEQACGFDDFQGTPAVGRTNAPDQTAMYTEAYEYDSAGNMLTMRHTRHTSRGPDTWTRHFGYGDTAPGSWPPTSESGPSGSARLTHVGDENPGVSTATHQYDDMGNLLTERNARYEWDADDRLRSYREVKNGSVSVDASYAYSAGGKRAKKVVDKGTHRREVIEYVGDLFEYHRLETDRTASDGGTVTENNTIDIAGVARKRVGTPFDGTDRFENSDRPAVEYQYGDRTGGTSLTIDDDGTWTNREEFTPFGETTFGGYDRKRYRYTGSERDEESDLYYQGARYYAPWLCRWTTTDPAGQRDGTNLYRYVRNDPVNRADPSGTNSNRKEKNTRLVPVGKIDDPKRENQDDDNIKFKRGMRVGRIWNAEKGRWSDEKKRYTGGFYYLEGTNMFIPKTGNLVGKQFAVPGPKALAAGVGNLVDEIASNFDPGRIMESAVGKSSSAGTSDASSKTSGSGSGSKSARGDSGGSANGSSDPSGGSTGSSGGSSSGSGNTTSGTGPASGQSGGSTASGDSGAGQSPGDGPGQDGDSGGGNGGKSENTADKPEDTDSIFQAWRNGLGNLVTGAGMIVSGIAGFGVAGGQLLTPGPDEVLSATMAAFAIMGGIATVILGTVQTFLSIPLNDRQEKELNTAIGIASGITSTPGALLGFMVGAVSAAEGDTDKVIARGKKGAAIGSIPHAIHSIGSAKLSQADKPIEVVDLLVPYYNLTKNMKTLNSD